MNKKMKDGTTVNFTRKEYFHRIKIEKGASEQDYTFFNTTSGASGINDRDTNWPSADNTIPAHISMNLKRFGFSVVTPDGSPVLPQTLAIISQGYMTTKIGEREIKNGSLIEFFKQPMARKADSSEVSDAFAGPAYKDSQPETVGPKAVFKHTVHVGVLPQTVYLYALLDVDNNAK